MLKKLILIPIAFAVSAVTIAQPSLDKAPQQNKKPLVEVLETKPVSSLLVINKKIVAEPKTNYACTPFPECIIYPDENQNPQNITGRKVR